MANQATAHFEADMDPIEAAVHFVNLRPEIRTFQVVVTKKGEKPIFLTMASVKRGWLVGGGMCVCCYPEKNALSIHTPLASVYHYANRSNFAFSKK